MVTIVIIVIYVNLTCHLLSELCVIKSAHRHPHPRLFSRCSLAGYSLLARQEEFFRISWGRHHMRHVWLTNKYGVVAFDCVRVVLSSTTLPDQSWSPRFTRHGVRWCSILCPAYPAGFGSINPIQGRALGTWPVHLNDIH